MMEITSFQYGARREFRITLQILEFGGGLEAFTAAIGIAGPTLSIVSCKYCRIKLPVEIQPTLVDTHFIYQQSLRSHWSTLALK